MQRRKDQTSPQNIHVVNFWEDRTTGVVYDNFDAAWDTLGSEWPLSVIIFSIDSEWPLSVIVTLVIFSIDSEWPLSVIVTLVIFSIDSEWPLSVIVNRGIMFMML